MIQGRGSSSFPPKSFECVGVLGNIVRDELDGDKSAELKVFSFVDNAHTAAAELFHNPIMRDGLADHVNAAMWRAIMVGAEQNSSQTIRVFRRWPPATTKIALWPAGAENSR
jgi:hypothetical protein